VHYETWNTGVLGPVTLNGVNSGTWDMTKWKWSYKVLLKFKRNEFDLPTIINNEINICSFVFQADWY